MGSGQKPFPLAHRIRTLTRCDTATLDMIQHLHGREEKFSRGSEVFVAGVVAQRPLVVMSGWLMRTHILSDGRRQILGYLLPGDFMNFSLRSAAVPSFSSVECITDVVVADMTPLRRYVTEAADDDPVLVAIWTILALDEAMLLNSVARLTRQSAYERLAHLLLDLRYRLSLVGHADATSFDMRVSQQVLGDALGLSVVHVNRILMQLRREGLLERTKKKIALPFPEQLSRLVDHSIPRVSV